MQVVIPAAGIGSRFLPTTRVVPKELLPLGQWPLLHHALREAQVAGFDSAIIVIAADKTVIRKYFEPDPRLEGLLESRGDRQGLDRLHAAIDLARRMQVRFVERPPEGIGAAVLAAHAAGIDPPFGVLLPDDVVTTAGHWERLTSAHRHGGAAVLAVRRVDWSETSRFGIALCEPENGHLRVRHLVEKPPLGTARSNLSIFGRYIVTEEVLTVLRARFCPARGELQITDGFAGLVSRSPGVIAVEFTGDSYDCGTPVAYASSIRRYPWP